MHAGGNRQGSEELRRRARGDPQGAEEHTRRILGEEHPDTMTAKGNLALTPHARGDLQSAEWRVLAAMTRSRNEEHSHTLSAKGSLASALQFTEGPPGLEVLHGQVQEARTLSLGEECSDTMTAKGNLALTRTECKRELSRRGRKRRWREQPWRKQQYAKAAMAAPPSMAYGGQAGGRCAECVLPRSRTRMSPTAFGSWFALCAVSRAAPRRTKRA